MVLYVKTMENTNDSPAKAPSTIGTQALYHAL